MRVWNLTGSKCIWESSKTDKSGYLKGLNGGKTRLYMAMCGLMVFLFIEGVILIAYIHLLHILLESHLLATSQTTNSLA